MIRKVWSLIDGYKTYLLGAAYLITIGLESNGNIPASGAKVIKDVLEGGMLLTIRFGMKQKEKKKEKESNRAPS